MKEVLFIVILPLLFSAINSKPYYQKQNNVSDPICGYDACPEIFEDKINVHLVCHSHDDVGWLDTAEQYFYHQVQYILDSVVQALKQDPKRRFVQTETYFFRKWWISQDETTKQDVINLVNNGQLEMINSGWTSNDEAATHYQSTIDQYTLGHRYIDDIFGKCSRPKIGWQVDPFGHSSEQASLYAQMGFDSFFFTRLDFHDGDKRKAEKRTDLLWTGSRNLGDASNIFTSILYRHYNYPPGFCFDLDCNDPPIVTDEESPEYNWEQRVNDFTDYIKEQSQYYPTNNILITLGDDFRYKGALTDYINIDKLIRGFEKFQPTIDGKGINIFYSTPTCYTKGVHEYVTKNNYVLDVKTDDFIPLVEPGHRIVTGFFSSRASSKRYEKISNNILQIGKQLAALSDLPFGSNFKLEDAVGIMQHHDAITGTELQAVEKDYHRMMSIGIEETLLNFNQAITTLSGSSADLNFKYCPLANISICAESKQDSFNILLYNPLGRKISRYIQVPVDSGTWKITDSDGNEISNALTSPIKDFTYVANQLEVQLNSDVLHFKADLPALGYNVYKFEKTTSIPKRSQGFRDGEHIGFENTYVTFDPSTGLLNSMTMNGITLEVKQQLMYYKSASTSGAYAFRPDENEQEAIPFTDKPIVEITETDVVVEVRQEFISWGIQIIRIHPDEDFVEFDWIVGNIDCDDNVGKEVISRFYTNLNTNGIWYTDSNSRELVRRQLNYRPTFEYTNEEPQSGNYYPVTSRIVIRDEDQGIEFGVITDRSEGGSSLGDGQIELMVHRGTLYEEFGEHMYEMEYGTGLVVRGSHLVTFGKISNDVGSISTATLQRQLAQNQHLQPWMLFTSETIPKQSFVNQDLPENVHLLTLDKWNDEDGSLLIRLEHFLEKDDDTELSKEVTVDISKLFTSFEITELKEVALNGIIPLEEVSRIQWPQINGYENSDSIIKIENRLNRTVRDTSIKLAPMQIRTFIATISRN